MAPSPPPAPTAERRLSVDDLDAARRQKNTRLIADTVVVLVVVLGGFAIVQSSTAVQLAIVAASLAVYAGCSVLARRGHASVAAAVLIASPLISSTLTVVHEGRLGPSPYFVSVSLLFAAATMTERGVIAAIAGALASLAIMAAYTRSVLVEHDTHGRIIGPTAVLLIATGVVAVLLARSMRASLAESLSRERQAQAAEERAVEEELRYRLIADNTDDLITLSDPTGLCVYASPSHERILGIPPASLVGQRRSDLVHPDDVPEVTRAWREALERGRSQTVMRYRRPGSDEVVHLDAVLNAVDQRDGRYVAIAARDVTKQRSLAAQLEQAQKMEALGRLAGGVAHDFNNLLAIIQMCSSLAAAASTDRPEVAALLDDVLKASTRAASLTKQLLAFSRKQVIAPARIALGPALGDAVDLSRRLAGSAVTVASEIPEDLWDVIGTSAQVEQVVLNLAANARDAMPDGGTLRIAARNVPAGASRVDGPAVEIVVADTGAGMSAEVMKHVFEPFFTTKQPGAGTGLGLATCYGIIEQLGGTISVASSEGEGTTFTILLPRASEAPNVPQPRPRVAPAAPRPKTEGTVLVVDDDDTVRALMTKVVADLGYDVLDARSVDEAVLRAKSRAIDVLLTDLLLGAESGLDVMRAVRELHPGAGVVLTSGYAQNAEAVAEQLAVGVDFVPKPFTPEALAAALRRAFEVRTSRSEAPTA